MKQKKRYTSEEKIIIVREHLENQISVSELAEKYGVHPNAIYNWKKQMFESASEGFSGHGKRQAKKQSMQEKRIAELEQTLAQRETVIAEIVADNISLKKKLAGDGLTINGLNRKYETK